MQPDYGNGATRIILSAQGAAVLSGILASVFLEEVRTEQDLANLTDALREFWSSAQSQQAPEASFSPTDAHAIHAFLETLIVHLRVLFEGQ